MRLLADALLRVTFVSGSGGPRGRHRGHAGRHVVHLVTAVIVAGRRGRGHAAAMMMMNG